jgi:hypothetical protein
MRASVLDGLRGFFLVFMVVVHSNEILNVTLGKLNHHYFGWVEDAQGFIFISGLVVGLVYGGILDRRGSRDMRSAIFQRISTIYTYQAGLILLMLTVALMLGSSAVGTVLEGYYERPIEFTVPSLLLLSASQHMGILPMYIYFMIATPFALLAFKRGYGATIVIASALLWFVAQTGLTGLAVDGIEGAAASAGVTLKIGLFFNLLGWQVIYLLGLFLGQRWAQGRLDLSWLKRPQYQVAFYVAVAGIVLLGVFDRIIFDQIISDAYSDQFLAGNQREPFALIYPIAFALDLFALAWLLIAGPESGSRAIRWLAASVNRFLNHKALTFLGRHSLQVFSFHIVLVYGLGLILHGRQVGELVGTILLIGAVASLYVPAYLNEYLARRRRVRAHIAAAMS